MQLRCKLLARSVSSSFTVLSSWLSLTCFLFLHLFYLCHHFMLDLFHPKAMSPKNNSWFSLMDLCWEKSLPALAACEAQVSGFPAEKSSSFAPRRFQRRPPSPWQAETGWGSREEDPPPPSDSQVGPCLAASWQTSPNHQARRPKQRPVRRHEERGLNETINS